MRISETVNHKPIFLPTVLPKLLLDWYDQNARPLPWRSDRDPYRIWVSEIMLQQTGVEAVKKYYERFLSAAPTVEALAGMDSQTLLKLWEGLGYYTRARNLQKAAQIIVRDREGRFPETYEEIASLPGIGPYTAGAVASICFDAPTPAVDGNVIRVITRIAGTYEPVTDALKRKLDTALREIYPPARRGDFTQSLMELGATVCIPNGQPKCAGCPTAGFCIAKNEGTALKLPVKAPKPAKKAEEITVFILRHDGLVALRRRADSGLLGGLWELPNLPGRLDDKAAVSAAADWHIEPLALLKSTERVHVFTHIRWDMNCYHIDCRNPTPGFVWASPDALRDTYALPTAFRKCLD